MARGKKIPVEIPSDPTAFLLSNGVAEFVLMHTVEIKYMCMLGYTYMHGSKVFKAAGDKAAFSFKFVNMIMACTGGGILVPIFLNAIPVPLATDAYPIAIMTSFLIHTYFPILRDVLDLSPVFKTAIIVLYETMRASVVVKLTGAAGKAIPPSEFDFALFGPIFCGTIAGCGGAFLPFNKGLDPIKNGLAPPMFSAFIAATFYHLFLSTSLSEGIVEAPKKAHVIVALWFITYGLYSAGIFSTPAEKEATPPAKQLVPVKQEGKKKK